MFLELLIIWDCLWFWFENCQTYLSIQELYCYFIWGIGGGFLCLERYVELEICISDSLRVRSLINSEIRQNIKMKSRGRNKYSFKDWFNYSAGLLQLPVTTHHYIGITDWQATTNQAGSEENLNDTIIYWVVCRSVDVCSCIVYNIKIYSYRIQVLDITINNI